MTESDVNNTGKDIWSLISLDDLVTAISSLGERTKQLKDDSWRFTHKSKSSSSYWSEVINKLKLDDDEKIRHSLYNIWHSDRHEICKLVEAKKKEIEIEEMKERDSNDGNEAENGSIGKKIIATLPSQSSLPLHEPPSTRAYQKAVASGNIYERHCIRTEFISLTRNEWKSAYSRTDKKTNTGWTSIFDKKLKSIGNTCSLCFHSPNIPRGIRKRNCSDFWFSATCTGDICKRKYIVSHRREIDNDFMALFRVDVYGEENHSKDNVMRPRKMNAEERDAIGKRANQIGPVATFREIVEAADEKMLAAGNFSQCKTIEAVKKCGADYRKKMRFDEDVFRACRILSCFYRAEDVTSEQILDSTGGVLKPMKDQNDIYVYTIMFKDGIDALDNVPLAHAILTDHTVPSIGYFLGNVIHSVNQVTTKKKLRPPSFIIIDFSAALMNAALQQFNIESVNKHLKRCWNVIHGKYTAEEIRSLSFIHLCCCHVMHAVARSLNAEKIDKKTRETVLYIFAYMLCSNDINQLYDTLGLVIDIFGDPNEQNAKRKVDQICSLKLNVDEESESVLKDFDNIFRIAEKKEEELKLVDEYFDSDEAIIHQSPFNKQAVTRYPLLAEILIKKKIKSSNKNTLFSASIIRIFYRWWAYLPLWTGLLFNFEERYANDMQQNTSITYYPIRYSNAVIESYFRTLKKSICQGKRSKPPQEVIMALHRSVKVQSKADQFGLTQGSKGRKRGRHNVGIFENWKNRTQGKSRRGKYTKLIDKFASKRARQEEDQSQQDGVESKNTKTTSSSNKSESSSKTSSENVSITESFSSSTRNSSSSSEAASKVSYEYPNDIPIVLDLSTNNNHQKSGSSSEKNLNMSSSSIKINTSIAVNEAVKVTTNQLSEDPSIKIQSHPTTTINGFTLKWPKFEVKNTLFKAPLPSLPPPPPPPPPPPTSPMNSNK
ncbi:unnamed protein product [Rotaria sp. Silwood2]|nr:unnamed protein product [Rotaria sp. Silwood2]CAF3078767.1 unnamed protein product [Rotaria sp. Silwood2]